MHASNDKAENLNRMLNYYAVTCMTSSFIINFLLLTFFKIKNDVLFLKLLHHLICPYPLLSLHLIL